MVKEIEQDYHKTIIKEIEKFSTIVISRHKLPDGDAYGSSHGLAILLRNKYPDKRILIINEDQSTIGNLFGPENTQISNKEYEETLLIVTDTADAKRISNSKYHLAKKVIKIDHHTSTGDYGHILLTDSTAASASEMVVRFGLALGDIDTLVWRKAAQYLYTGIATDTGMFRYPSTTADTMRAAAECLRLGANPEETYESIFLEPYRQMQIRIKALSKVAHTKRGVAYLMFDVKRQKALGITAEIAARYVNDISLIRESPIYLAFIENADGTWRCRIRSRRIPIVQVAEKRNGGGHLYAAGCVVTNISECNQVLDELGSLIKEVE